MDKTKEKICHKIILQVTTCHTLVQRSKTQNKRLFFIIRLSFHWLFVTFEPSQLTVKSNEVFFIRVSLLLSLSVRSSRKKGAVGKSADRIIPSVLLEWLSVPSLLRGAWRKPNWFPHREECCEHFRPSPIRNPEWPFFVLLLCSRQPPQKLPRRCTASVLCKFSSLYSQNSTFNNLLNSSHKCNRPSHLRNYDPKFSQSIFFGSQIA